MKNLVRIGLVLLVVISFSLNVFLLGTEKELKNIVSTQKLKSNFALDNTELSQVLGRQVEEEVYIVKKVIDGDTIVLNNNAVVRYIGIDTPENPGSVKKECFAKESYLENSKLVAGKTVRLEKDVSEKDRYGRLLRYVWVGDTFVNEQLVRDGYAQAVTYPPDVSYSQLFAQAQVEAREENKGLWGGCEFNSGEILGANEGSSDNVEVENGENVTPIYQIKK